MSNNAVKAAFEKQVVVLPLDIIVPQKEVTKGNRGGEFYGQLTPRSSTLVDRTVGGLPERARRLPAARQPRSS